MTRSFLTAQCSLLIGKLDLDLVAVRFGDWRIRFLHDLLGLLIGFLQKLALSKPYQLPTSWHSSTLRQYPLPHCH